VAKTEKITYKNSKKKIIFIIWTQAHYHFFKNAIKELSEKNEIIILARSCKNIERLFQQGELKYEIVAAQYDNLFLKVLGYVKSIFKIFLKILRIRPKLIIGVGSTGGALASFFLRIPSIMYEDDEITTYQQITYVPFVDHIIVPEKFRRCFGKKEIRLWGYKELAYLHPNRFLPNKTILVQYGLSVGDTYTIIRLNPWNAYHDTGQKGISIRYLKDLVSTFSQYGKVLLSTEKVLPKEYSTLLIRNPSHIHHLLYYASLLFSDSQTMSTEGAILGVPVIRFNSFVGKNDMSNFIELEEDYGLIFNIKDAQLAKKKAIELLQQKDVKSIWNNKKKLLYRNKIDVTGFLIWLIENYPQSVRKLQKNPDYQLKFK